MAPNEAAHANHARMLPGHVSTLAVTDPELIDLFDNFAFDEVLRASKLDEPTRLLCQLAAMIAVGGTIEFRVMLGAALNVGVAPVAAKEVLAERGVDLPLEGQATTTPATRLEHGRGLQEQVVGAEAVALMYASAPADEQHIQRLLSANCFGDHVSRGGLDLATRELLTFSMLAALGGCEPQLRGHVAANLRVGNDRSQLIDVLTQLLPFIGYPRLLNALRVGDEAAPAAPGEEIPA